MVVIDVNNPNASVLLNKWIAGHHIIHNIFPFVVTISLH